jgi:hypothetical protein
MHRDKEGLVPMAKGIERVGETGLKAEWEFPDESSREDFEIAFGGWLKQYQHVANTQRLVGALAAKAAEDDEDTAGYLLEYYDKKAKKTIYLNFI